MDLTTSIIRKPSQLGFLACAARVSQLLRGRCRMSSTGQASVKSRPKMAMPAYCSVLRHHVCRFRNHINLFSIHKYIRDVYIYIYGKCLGFARNRNHDRQSIIIIIVIIVIIIIIFFFILIKPLLQIFNDCRSLTGVAELNPYRKYSMNVEV